MRLLSSQQVDVSDGALFAYDLGSDPINRDVEIAVKWEDVTIKVPAVVSGDYLAFSDECVYLFDPDAAIKGCKLLFCVRFERVIVTGNRWTFDVEGESQDACDTF